MHFTRLAALRFALSLAALTVPAAAQDMIGVTFPGQVLRIDSTTGATTLLASGQLGKNCLACTGDNRLWTTVRTGNVTSGFQFFLTELNPFTGAETIGTVDIGDIRAMTGDRTRTGLWGIRENGNNDQLVQIDTTTGAVTVVGNTGFGSIQSLDTTALALGAFDLTAGLVRVDPTTGLATDPFPGVGAPAGMQFLTTNPATSECFVGRGDLHRVDLFSGTTTFVRAIQGNPDLRGAEFTTPRFQLVGFGCAGVGGGVRIGADIAPPGQTLTVQTNQHAPGAFGVQILGFSETAHAGNALPFSLDPLLGTSGCKLNVSIDLTSFGITDALGNLTQTMVLPASFAFFQFYVQHAVFEAVPGGMSWSSGLRVRPAL